MDNLTHFVLGASIGGVVMGRRTAVWKAVLWGGLCANLPDLDVFFDHGDPISNVTLHRGNSHALLWLTLASPLIAAGIAALHRESRQFPRWWLAIWLVLMSHPLLDAMTIYGTQLARPFTDKPYGVGSMFIIDPLFTLPMLVGVIAALSMRDARGLRWASAGLLLGSGYLAWSYAAQQHVQAIASASLAEQGIESQRLMVTPTPFNTVLWRVVAVMPQAYHEGFYSLLDSERQIRFDRFERGEKLYSALAGQRYVDRIAWFSRGFFKLSQQGAQVLITDLRMGLEPAYTFSFVVAQVRADTGQLVPAAVPVMAGGRVEIGRGLAWVMRRASGDMVHPPWRDRH